MFVLQNLERWPCIPIRCLKPPRTSDALSPLHSKPPKEITMERYYEPFKRFRARAATAAFATSATLLVALVGAFYSVSSEPVLADSPQARSAVAGCDARGDQRRAAALRATSGGQRPRRMTPVRRSSPRSRPVNAARGSDAHCTGRRGAAPVSSRPTRAMVMPWRWGRGPPSLPSPSPAATSGWRSPSANRHPRPRLASNARARSCV